MTFRARILTASLLVALAPLALFALGARNAVRARLTEQFAARLTAASDVVRADLVRTTALLDARLRALAAQIRRDPQLRAALTQAGTLPDARVRVLDYAPEVMPALALDYLLLLDSAGTVLSSGHFRNEYDRTMRALPQLLQTDSSVLIATRRPTGTMLVLARAYDFTLGDRRLALIAGTGIDSTFLNNLAQAAGDHIAIALEYGDRMLSAAGGGELLDDGATFRAQIHSPFIDDVSGNANTSEARWTIAQPFAPLQRVQNSMDLWFAAATGAAVLLAVLVGTLMARRINRPLEELATTATRVKLDRVDVEFATRRDDELGTLARLLDSMVQRLRRSAQQLRAAERRATVGDMARQVNHDIRNGLVPLRNVIRHMSQVAQETPEQLAPVFSERAGTLYGGLEYLEQLATSYARLSVRGERQLCDLNAIIRDVLRDSADLERARIITDLSQEPARVSADPVALRRVIENLTVNALESLGNGTGRVTLRTAVEPERVLITVADTGSGIEPQLLERVFDDFFTTKESGTGLGLSIVRRLVTDMGGRIHVQSTPGVGSTFQIELPLAA